MIYCFIKINQNIAIEGLSASCLSSPWTCFLYFLISAKSNDITKIFVKSFLVQKIAQSSIYDNIMSHEHFEIKNKDLRPL